MYKKTHLGEVMETTCNHCKSRFRLTDRQLKQAYGKVRCGECGSIFNAMNGLKNYEGELPPDYLEQLEESEPGLDETVPISDLEARPGDPDFVERRQVSLHEAMYGSEKNARVTSPLAWFNGILL